MTTDSCLSEYKDMARAVVSMNTCHPQSADPVLASTKFSHHVLRDKLRTLVANPLKVVAYFVVSGGSVGGRHRAERRSGQHERV